MKVRQMTKTLRGSVLAPLAIVIIVAGLPLHPAAAETSQDIMARHFGTMTVNGKQAVGERPLAVALLEFRDMPMPQNRAYYDWLWFAAGAPSGGLNAPPDVKPGNVPRAFLENSYGRFTWRKAGLLGPFRHPDDPLTTADEASSACVLKPENCPGMGLITIRTSNGKNMWRVGEPGVGSIVDAAAHDPHRNGEGITLVDLNRGALMDGDYVNLVSFHRFYIAAEGGGGGELVGNRPAAREWERFRLFKRGGSTGSEIRHGDGFAIQAYSGQYVTAENGGGSTLRANRTFIGTWETFTLMEQSHNNGRQLRTAMELSIAAGFDPAAFDRQGDGDSVVEEDELAFVRVLSNGSPWGQQGNYLGRYRPTGSTVDILPSYAVFDAYPGLDTIVHEMAHALRVEHVYGSQSNSYYLTPMSGTVGDATGDMTEQYDRDTFHLDPWTKFRLGWLYPALIRTDTPVNGCRPIDATDTDDPTYMHGATFGFFRPGLYYDETRPNEYYMVEYRKGAGYDADVASEGLAVWFIKVKDDGNLFETPGQRITAGADGILQSVRRPDDQQSGNVITSGNNRWLDSEYDQRDDRSVDPVNVALGAPNSSWGGNRLWTRAEGIFRPLRLDRRPSNISIQVAQPTGTSIDVETTVGGPFRPSISSVSPTIGWSRTVFRVRGSLGVQGAKRVEARNVLTGAKYTGEVFSWTCSQARVQFGLPNGAYDITVISDDNKVLSGTQRIFIHPIPFDIPLLP